MPIGQFFVRCFFATFFIGMLLFFFYPRYEYIKENQRFDKISGNIEHHDFWGWK